MGEGLFMVVVEIFVIDESFDLLVARIWDDPLVTNFFFLDLVFWTWLWLWWFG